MTTQDEGRDDRFFFTQVTEDEGTEILSDRPPQAAMQITRWLPKLSKQLLSELLRLIQGPKMSEDNLSPHVANKQQKRVNQRHGGSIQYTLHTEPQSTFQKPRCKTKEGRHTYTMMVVAMLLPIQERRSTRYRYGRCLRLPKQAQNEMQAVPPQHHSHQGQSDTATSASSLPWLTTGTARTPTGHNPPSTGGVPDPRDKQYDLQKTWFAKRKLWKHTTLQTSTFRWSRKRSNHETQKFFRLAYTERTDRSVRHQSGKKYPIQRKNMPFQRILPKNVKEWNKIGIEASSRLAIKVLLIEKLEKCMNSARRTMKENQWDCHDKTTTYAHRILSQNERTGVERKAPKLTDYNAKFEKSRISWRYLWQSEDSILL